MAQRRPRPTKGFASAGPARVPVSDRLSGFRLVNTGRLQGPIPVGAASFSCDRLPKIDTISLRIGNPAKLSEVIAFAFWIDGDTFVYQTVQHSIEVIHLEIDHRFLRRREVCIVWFEKGEDDLSVLRGWGETRMLPRTSPDRDAAHTIGTELLDHPLARIYRQSQ